MAELNQEAPITLPPKCVLVDEKPLSICCEGQLHKPTLPSLYNSSQHQLSSSDGGFLYRENEWKGRRTVLGAFIGLFCSFGQLNAFGTFQAWYATHQLSHLTPSTISWIGSLQLWMFFFSVRSSSQPIKNLKIKCFIGLRYWATVRSLWAKMDNDCRSDLLLCRHDADKHLCGVLSVHTCTGHRFEPRRWLSVRGQDVVVAFHWN